MRGRCLPTTLAGRAVERRAIEAVIWGMPTVNFDLLYQAMAQAKGSWNEIVYWSRLPDWKNQTLTPNPDVIPPPHQGCWADGDGNSTSRVLRAPSVADLPQLRPAALQSRQRQRGDVAKAAEYGRRVKV